MKQSTNRVLVTHQGTLPRPPALYDLLSARANKQPYDDQPELSARIKDAVAEGVRRSAACGIDTVNDGEYSKSNFNDSVNSRLSGLLYCWAMGCLWTPAWA